MYWIIDENNCKVGQYRTMWSAKRALRKLNKGALIYTIQRVTLI